MTQHILAGVSPVRGEAWYVLKETNSAAHGFATYVPASEFDPDDYHATGFQTQEFTPHTVYQHGGSPEAVGRVIFNHREEVAVEDLPFDPEDESVYWGNR